MMLKQPINQSQWFALATLLLSGFCLCGWITNKLIIASFGSNLIMLAPSTGVCFLFLGIALYGISNFKTASPRKNVLCELLVAITFLFGLGVLLSFFSGTTFIVEQVLNPSRGTLNSIPIGRMSPITAGLFLFSSAVFPFYIYSMSVNRTSLYTLSGLFSVIVILASLLLIIGYLYGVPFFYDGSLIPPALPTLLCFFILNVGSFYMVGARSPLFVHLLDDSVFGRLARSLIPLIFLLIFFKGWADSKDIQFFSNQALNRSVFYSLLVLSVGLVILFQARRIGAQIERATNQVRESQERYSFAEAAVNDGLWDWNILTSETYFSPRWQEIIGYKKGELSKASSHFFDRIHPDDQELASEVLRAHSEEGKIYEVELRLRHKNGSYVWVFSRGKVVAHIDGQPARMVGSITDITQRKQAEAEQKKLNGRLNQMQKLESIGLLAGGIAHDFNNLLGGIYGYIEVALMETTEEGVTTCLNKAVNSMDRATALTQQFLTFAKGGAPVKRVENLFPVVQETVKFALSGSSVLSQFDIQDDLWPCDFDKNQIGQVVENLTINAQQAMPTGGTINVSAQNILLAENEHDSLGAGNYVKLSIKDQGIGIPEEFLPRIFDPYYTTKPNGHGLGLATCYSIARRHDGCIDIESETGKGCTFHLYLPAVIEPVAIQARKSAGKHAGSGTFLVMDDEESIREIIKKMIETMGYTIVLTENGKDAINFIKAETQANRKLAGVILDLTIPGGMGGKEAIEEIRKICPETPAFVASGYFNDPVIANPEKYGFTASIGKPFQKADLSEMLEMHMKKQL